MAYNYDSPKFSTVEYSDAAEVEALYEDRKKRHQTLTYVPITTQLIRDIEAALQAPTYITQPGDAEHMSEVYQNRAMCPVCNRYDHFDRVKLKQHIGEHDEIIAFIKAQQDSQSEKQALQDRQARIRLQLTTLRQQLGQTSEALDRLDSAKYAEQQRNAARLSKVLNQWT